LIQVLTYDADLTRTGIKVHGRIESRLPDGIVAAIFDYGVGRAGACVHGRGAEEVERVTAAVESGLHIERSPPAQGRWAYVVRQIRGGELEILVTDELGHVVRVPVAVLPDSAILQVQPLAGQSWCTTW
jgi:hypothetical protein